MFENFFKNLLQKSLLLAIFTPIVAIALVPSLSEEKLARYDLTLLLGRGFLLVFLCSWLAKTTKQTWGYGSLITGLTFFFVFVMPKLIPISRSAPEIKVVAEPAPVMNSRDIFSATIIDLGKMVGETTLLSLGLGTVFLAIGICILSVKRS